MYRVFSEDEMANLHLQGSLSTTGARNFKKLVVYAKVKVLGDSQYQRAELDYRIDICRVTFVTSSDKLKKHVLQNHVSINNLFSIQH